MRQGNDSNMREVKNYQTDIISIPADEVIKLVFGADRAALIQFINSVFNKAYNAESSLLSISNANFINSETFDKIYGDFIVSIDNDFYHFEFQTRFDTVPQKASHGALPRFRFAVHSGDTPADFSQGQPTLPRMLHTSAPPQIH